MAMSRRTTSTGAAAARPRRASAVKPGLTPPLSLDPLIDRIGDTVEGILKRGSMDLMLAVVPHLGDMEAAQALAARYARDYEAASGVPEPEPLADLAGVQQRVTEALRSGIADALGRDPFLSLVDEGPASALPDLPEVTADNLDAVPTPAEFTLAAMAQVLFNITRRTRFGVSAGTVGPPRDADVLAADEIDIPSPEVSEDGAEFAAGFGVVARPSFVLALARTLLTPLSLAGEPCECGPIVLSNPRVVMADGTMTDRIDATLAGAATATVTLVDQVRVTHGLESSSITGRIASTDVAVHPLTARARRLDADAWRTAVLAMIAPPQLARLAVRGVLGRLAERNLPALPSPIALLGASLPFGAYPLAPTLDDGSNPLPSTQTVVLGARHRNGTTALRADITADALRASGLVLLRPRRAAVSIAVQVRDAADRDFTATATDVEMMAPSFSWTLSGATLIGDLEGASIRFRAASGATVTLRVTAAGADGLTREADLTLDIDAFLDTLVSTPTT
ncbi:MAG: hypothetical protein R3B59_10855 [Dehalococcoidia bacterium]